MTPPHRICGYCHAHLEPGTPCHDYPVCCPRCDWPMKPERGCSECGHGLKTTLELLAQDLGMTPEEVADLAAARLDVGRLVDEPPS